MLTVGSLFSGIGGFDLGLERAGMRVLWQCEANEFCRRVLAKHWPGIPCYEDVRDIDAGTPAVDVLCGGFPCQPVSVAGRGLAQADERWLWPEFARVVGELRPSYVLVENVPALLGRGAGDVLGDLASLGYDAEWDCLPAAAIGAHHLRDRLWIVAYPGGPRRREDPGSAYGDEAAHEGRSTTDDHESHGDVEGDRAGAVAHATSIGLRSRRARRSSGGDGRTPERALRVFGAAPKRLRWLPEPDVGRMAHGVSGLVDRGRALGNALVPQIAEWIGERIVSYEREAA